MFFHCLPFRSLVPQKIQLKLLLFNQLNIYLHFASVLFTFPAVHGPTISRTHLLKLILSVLQIANVKSFVIIKKGSFKVPTLGSPIQDISYMVTLP